MLTLDANIWVAAYDPTNRFHADSVRFLRVVAQQTRQLTCPAFLVVEISCALARRTQNAAAGQAVVERLRKHPALTLLPVSDGLLAPATHLGTQNLLRAADALYAATAELSASQLVSWDGELVRRAGAVTPVEWLAIHA